MNGSPAHPASCRTLQAGSLRSPINRAARLAVLTIDFVANLIVVTSRGAGKLVATFRYKIWILPVGPGTVFRSHRIGRQFELEDPVWVAGKFQNEEPLRSAE